jgi:hypothetical protein
MKNSKILLLFLCLFALFSCLETRKYHYEEKNFNKAQADEIIEEHTKHKAKRDRHRKKVRKIENENLKEINQTNDHNKVKRNPKPKFEFY